MSFLLPIHPRLVHFPIALSLTGVAFVVLGLALRRERWTDYGRMSLFLGWLALIVASLGGLIDESRAPATAVVTAAINQHITVAISLIVVFGLALYWPLRNRKLWTDPGHRLLYIALLILGALLILLEGWLGGKLVYTLGVGTSLH